MTSTTSSTETRALELLGQGIGPEMVASAIGISVSRISQLLSQPEFVAQVAELRYKSLAKHNERDNNYDNIEDKLLKKLDNLLPFMMKPLEVLRAIQVINAAKRRGSSAPESITNTQEVVKLTMPIQVNQQFITNINGQVVKAGEQELITIQSGSLSSLLSSRIPAPKLTQDVHDVQTTT